MTVSVETNKSQLLVYSAAIDEYSWGAFDAPSSEDLRVYVIDNEGNGDQTLLTPLTHYTVDLVNKRIELTASGHVFISGLNYSDERVSIYRSIASLTQTREYTNQGAFLSQSIEDSFDKIYYILQEHSEVLQRAIQIDPFDPLVSGYPTEEEQRQAVVLPSLGGIVADGIVFWDASEQQFSVSDSVALDNVSTIVTNLDDVAVVAADLEGDNTVGTVAADLTGANTIGSAGALVNGGSPGIVFLQGPGAVGLVTVGSGLSFNTTSGVLEADPSTITPDDLDDSSTVNKFVTAEDLDKLAGIEELADVTDSTNVAAALGSISINAISDVDTLTISNDQILVWNTAAGTFEPGDRVVNLDDLEDVDASSPTNGEALIWNASLSRWEAGLISPSAVTSINGSTGDVVLDADDIDDSTTAHKFLSAGDLIKLSGIEAGADVTDVTNVTSALGSISINALSDVDAGSATDGQYLAWNNASGAWEPSTAGSAAVDSVNGLTGVVVLDPDDLDDTSTTNKFTTAADISKLAGIEAGATADQTGAEIKAAYEGEADTNAFTDAEKTKLAGITAGADLTSSGNETISGDWTFSGDLTYTATGANTAQTAQDRAADFLSLADFGATGDGSTDDSTAISAALSAASGKTLFLPDNTFTALRTSGSPLTIPANTRIQGLSRDGGFELDVNTSSTVELFQAAAGTFFDSVAFTVDAVSGATAQIIKPTGDNVTVINSTFDGGTTGNPVVHCIDFADVSASGFLSFGNTYKNANRVFLKTNSSTTTNDRLKFIGDKVEGMVNEAMAFNNPNPSASMQDILAFGLSFVDSPRRVHALGGASIQDARFVFNSLSGTGDELAHFEEKGRRLVHMGTTALFTDAISGTFWGPNNVSGTTEWPKYAAEGYNVTGLADDRQTITALSEAADTLTIAGHGYDNNQQVIYRNTGTTDIGGLEDGAIYFVRNPTTDTFQLSAAPGGSAIALDTTPDDTLPSGTHTIQALGSGFLFANSPLFAPAAEYIVSSNNVAYDWGRGLAIPSRMQNNMFTNNMWVNCDYAVFSVRPTLAIRNNMSVDSYAYDFETQASGLFGRHSFRRARNAAYSANVTGVSEAADTLSFSSHDFLDGDRVFYVYRDPDSTGGNAVPGLTSGDPYYVVNRTSTTIQLAGEPGGSAIALNASGGTTLPGGDHRVSKWEGIEAFIPRPIKLESGHVAGFEAWDLEIDPVTIPDMASGENWAIIPLGAKMGGRLKVMLSANSSTFQTRISDVGWDGTTFTETNINDLGSGGIDLFDLRESGGNLCLRLNNTTGTNASARIQVIFDGIHLFT